MAQIFHPATNTFSRVSIFGAVFFIAALVWLGGILVRSPYMTEEGVALEQPVPFSHAHHVGHEGFDCRYCHTSVEESSYAGMPSTEVCMNCHRYIWRDSPMLQPVRESLRDERSLEWTRVHNLADFCYFNHSIHIHKGIGCSTCHGRVDRMPLMYKANALHMEWCLECHRNPEKYVRPRERVFDMDWQPPEDQLAQGARLVKEYGIETKTSCSICHR